MPLGIPHSEFLSWEDSDQDKALAFNREKTDICIHCGSRASEWEKNRFAYVAETERCPGCELVEQEQDNLSEVPARHRHGVRVVLRPTLPGEVG